MRRIIGWWTESAAAQLHCDEWHVPCFSNQMATCAPWFALAMKQKLNHLDTANRMCPLAVKISGGQGRLN
jgi:hypothetical protein